jgi:hypothetical protein
MANLALKELLPQVGKGLERRFTPLPSLFWTISTWLSFPFGYWSLLD